MMQGCFRSGEIDDHFASVEERREIVGDWNPCMATARCLPGIVADSVMALPFNSTGQRQGGGIFDNILTTKLLECPSNTIFLSTLGTSDDIYKLHRIRILNVYGNYEIPVNFAITRSYNNIGATNIETLDGITSGSGTFTQPYIEFRMKNYSIIRKINRGIGGGSILGNLPEGLANATLTGLVT